MTDETIKIDLQVWDIKGPGFRCRSQLGLATNTAYVTPVSICTASRTAKMCTFIHIKNCLLCIYYKVSAIVNSNEKEHQLLSACIISNALIQ